MKRVFAASRIKSKRFCNLNLVSQVKTGTSSFKFPKIDFKLDIRVFGEVNLSDFVKRRGLKIVLFSRE